MLMPRSFVTDHYVHIYPVSGELTPSPVEVCDFKCHRELLPGKHIRNGRRMYPHFTRATVGHVQNRAKGKKEAKSFRDPQLWSSVLLLLLCCC